MIGFWIFILIMDLLIPIIMVGFGMVFVKKLPKSINKFYGYRTTMSMKNQNTWEFAQRYCGKLLLKLGLILFPITLFPLLFVFGKDVTMIGVVGGIVCAVQTVSLVAPVFPTEHALKKTFDQNGERRRI